MKIKITSRDVKFFFLGILTIILIDLVVDWENNINGFKDGFNSAIEKKVPK